jgi:hypothetical protein
VLCYVFRGDFGRLGHGDCSDVFVPQQIAFFNSMAIKQVRVSVCGGTAGSGMGLVHGDSL